MKPSARRDRLSSELRKLLSKVSGEDITDTDTSTTFVELGFDSLLLTQVAQKISQTFGLPLKLRQLLEDLSTVAALATHLDERLPPDSQEAANVVNPEFTRSAVLRGGSLETAAPVTIQLITKQLALMTCQLELVTNGRITSGARAALAAPISAAVTAGLERVVRARAALSAARSGASLDPDVPPISITKRFGSESHRQRLKTPSLTVDQQRYVERLVLRYAEKTKASKAFTQRNRGRLADPGVAAGFSANLKEVVYPIVVGRSSGCRLWDLDGNEYVDLLSGHGSNFLGYSPPFVKEAIKAQLDRGIETGPQHPLAESVAELVSEFTGMERVLFCNTGSEAVQGAIRLARTVTGKNTIVVFNGSYHGLFDEVIVRGTKDLRSLPGAAGIPASAMANVLVLEYGDPNALEILRGRIEDIAAVLVEPVQSRRPELLPIEFLRQLRTITEQAGVALVFDEVVTGFRCAPGGAQERFGIRADIAVYGGALGGGLPIGVIAGKPTYMDAIDGGHWQYGDDSIPEVGVTYFVGSFARHPLALAATKAVLEHLKAEGPRLQQAVDAKATRFANTLNAWLEHREVPVVINCFSSIAMVAFKENVPFRDLLFLHLREKGVHVFDHRPGFFTAAHTDADVDFAVERFQESVTNLSDGGFLRHRIEAERHDQPPLPGARLGRDAKGNPAWFVPDPARPGMFQQVEAAL